MNRVLLAVLAFAVVYQVSGEPAGARDGLMREVRRALSRETGRYTWPEDHIYCGAVLEQNRESVCGIYPSAQVQQRNEFTGKEAASNFLERGIQDLTEECCGEGCYIEEIRESC